MLRLFLREIASLRTKIRLFSTLRDFGREARKHCREREASAFALASLLCYVRNPIIPNLYRRYGDSVFACIFSDRAALPVARGGRPGLTLEKV